MTIGESILPDDSIYQNVKSYFKIEAYDQFKVKDTIFLAGYPAQTSRKVRKTDKTINYHYENGLIKYDFETEHGDSGDPIWYNDSGVPTVFAIHTNGGATCATATVITPYVYDRIVQFCLSKGIDITH